MVVMVCWHRYLTLDLWGRVQIPIKDILDFFAVFPNFKGKFPVCANFREHGTLSMLIYMLQRVARAKSHSRAITCSVCQFSKEKCNY